jgi:Tfp pilus assembly protein PilE
MPQNNLAKHYKTSFSEGGLTLVEVIVGMLVAAVCLGTALQAYVAAVSIKVKAQQMNTAIAKIDADSETIRQISQVPQSTPIQCSGNYAQSLMNKVVERDNASTAIGGADLSPSGAAVSPAPTSPPSSSAPQSFMLPDLPQDYQLERKMTIDPNAPKVLKVSYVLTHLPRAAVVTSPPLAQLSLAVMPRDALVCP